MILDELGAYLSTGGAGTLGVDLFEGLLPDRPDDATAIYESGGYPSAHAMTASPGKAMLQYPTIQVIARGATYTSARQRAETAYRLLDGARGLTLSGVTYHWITAMQPPFGLGQDANGRPQISFNCAVSRSS